MFKIVNSIKRRKRKCNLTNTPLDINGYIMARNCVDRECSMCKGEGCIIYGHLNKTPIDKPNRTKRK